MHGLLAGPSTVPEGSRQGTPSPDAEPPSAEAGNEEAEMTEEERIAQLGKPKLGDLVSINVHIRESIEFKVHAHMKCSQS